MQINCFHKFGATFFYNKNSYELEKDKKISFIFPNNLIKNNFKNYKLIKFFSRYKIKKQ